MILSPGSSYHFSPLFFLIIIFSFLVLFCNPGTAQDPGRDLDRYLGEYYDGMNIPSVSAGVLHNGKIIWLNTLGYADIENNVRATNKSLYRIASISKSITAVAVMQLAEQGKIKLDEDARKYIPYLPMKNWRFTPRQILSHTAGIRNYRSSVEFESKEFYKNTRETVNLILNDTIEYEPGTKHHYTTLGYNLLAAIIENVSKMSFPDYLKEFIYKPAGMSSTGPDIQKQLIRDRVRGYEKDNSRNLQNASLADLSIKVPGGGLLSSTEDLLKFSQALLEGKLIRRATLDSMIVPTRLKNGKLQDYGLGFALGTDSLGRKYIFHPGSGTGFSSFLLIYPNEKFAAVYLINARDRNLGNPAADFVSIVLDKKSLKPVIPVSDHLLKITLESGIDTAITAYKKIKSDSTYHFSINDDELMLFGYDLISNKRYTDAIIFFKQFVKEFPGLAKGYIGLADAYHFDGNKGLSLKNYLQALRFDPDNKYVAKMIRKMDNNP